MLNVLVNAGFEQMNKPQWIPFTGYPKGAISKRRIWKHKGLHPSLMATFHLAGKSGEARRATIWLIIECCW